MLIRFNRNEETFQPMNARLWLPATFVVVAGFSAEVASPGARTLVPALLCGESQICGLNAPEDLVRIGAGSVIASRLAGGGLDVIEVATHRVTPIDLNQVAQVPDPYYGCSELNAPDHFVSHGLSFKPHLSGRSRLYVVRHGGREAIEIFAFGRPADVRSLRWIGCVPLPQGFQGNAVAGRRDGGFYVTSMFDMGEASIADKKAKLYAAQVSGAVLRWMPETGFESLRTDLISGPNGVELSADERWLYVAGWASRDVSAFDLLHPQASPRRLRVDFMPDNLRWRENGHLVAAGMRAVPESTFECAMIVKRNERCATHWSVVTIDANRMILRHEISRDAQPQFGDVSVALPIGNDLWLGSFSGDRVAIESTNGTKAQVRPDSRPP
jgi:hypothetical protein